MDRSALALLSVLSLVNAQAALTNIVGGNGVTNVGLGVQSQTPNSGQGITVSGGGCGAANTAQALATSTANGIATPDDSGNLNMEVFIINSQGEGPYTCALDTTGAGNSFNTPLTIKTNVNNQVGQACSLVAAMPSGITCPSAGCIVQCKNSAGFGGCVPVAPSNTATGSSGTDGNTGSAATGNSGNAGNAGDTGNNGNTGNTGNTGNAGNAGNTGNPGNSGSPGQVAKRATPPGNGADPNVNVKDPEPQRNPPVQPPPSPTPPAPKPGKAGKPEKRATPPGNGAAGNKVNTGATATTQRNGNQNPNPNVNTNAATNGREPQQNPAVRPPPSKVPQPPAGQAHANGPVGGRMVKAMKKRRMH
ncbi:hypothetical protein BT69DRAFT_1008730 [Atractiella rhizophila]|nr:hypothetical protein BT69DRAFT_1008730 [Atractiella rhizophila]